MSSAAPAPTPKRYRYPTATVIRILLAATVLLSVMSVASIAGMVWLLVEVQDTQEQTFESRRGASTQSCKRDERLRGDIRAVLALRKRNGDPSEVPTDPVTGAPLFSPLRPSKRGADPCVEYAKRVVPESDRP